MPLPRSIRRSVSRQGGDLLKTGRRLERFDKLRQRHFWSSAYFVADANQYVGGSQQLFITPPGQNGQGFPSGYSLTERDTNWKSSNRVPDNQNFEVTELGVWVGFAPNGVPGGDNEVLNGFIANSFLQNAVLSIVYLTNEVPLGMASDFGQAGGPWPGDYVNLSNNTTGEDPDYSSNGFSAPALRRRFKIPILLQHGETFSFKLSIPAGREFYTVGIDIYARVDFFATESFAEKS